MRKDELVARTMANLSKQGVVLDPPQLMRIVETLLMSIKEVLIEGHHIEIRGFGTFSVRDRSNRTAWNPVKKETFTVQGKKVPFFKPGTIFRKEVQQGRLLGDKAEEPGT
jgi:integration host factor subunit beta